jgi:hypothetical protein
MGTYDWMELQTLTNDIAAARTRLAAARATKDVGKARGLEEEIARAEAQRDRLLAHITTNLVAAPDPPLPKRGKDAAPPATAAVEPKASAAATEEMPAAADPVDATPPAAAAEDAAAAAAPSEPEAPVAAARDGAAAPGTAELPPPEATVTEQHPPQTEDRVVATGAAPPAPAPKAAGAEGGRNVWEQLKPSDIERAKQDLETRRTEMLARHAEELRGLEADQAQLGTLEEAIAAFLQKFNAPPGGAGVVKLDAERELRQTAG